MKRSLMLAMAVTAMLLIGVCLFYVYGVQENSDPGYYAEAADTIDAK